MDVDLLRLFSLNASLPDLCRSVGRTPYAILTRLQDHGVLTAVNFPGEEVYYAKVSLSAWVYQNEVNDLSKAYL